MSSDFQKDLYKKGGSTATFWDVCIGLGLITIGSGAYMHFSEKKKSSGSLNIPEKNNVEERVQERVQDRVQERAPIRRVKKEAIPKPKEIKSTSSSKKEKEKDTLDKLGL